MSRRDNFAALFQHLAAAMFWWNPLLHRINRAANRLREQICDDYVVHSLGHGRVFAEALVKVAEWCVYGRQTMPAVATLIGKRDRLPARVHRLAEGTGTTILRPGRTTMLAFAAASVCGLALLVIPVLRPANAVEAEMQPVAEPTGQPAMPADETPPRFSVAEPDDLKDDDRFPSLIVASVLSELTKQQPSLMATELSRRVERRFRLIVEPFQTYLSSRELEWRRALMESLQKSIRLQFHGAECRDRNQPSAIFFDRLRTLEWKLWLAANRPAHLETDARRSAQQAWLRKHILSLPELRSQNGRVLYSRREAIADYEALASNPLEPICKTAMSAAQFAEFQREMLAYEPENAIQFAVAHTVRHEGWTRYSTPPVGELRFPAIQLPFRDVVASLGHHNDVLRLTFQTPDYFVPDRARYWNEPAWLPNVKNAATGQADTANPEPIVPQDTSSESTAEPLSTKTAEVTEPEPVKAAENGGDGKPTDSPAQSETSFRILDSAGEPVAGAKIRLIVQTRTHRELVDHQLLHETTTDDSGHFDLPPGRRVANAMDNRGLSVTWVTVPAREGNPEQSWLLGTSAGAVVPLLQAVWAAIDSKTVNEPAKVADPVAISSTFRLPLFNTPLRIVNPDGTPAVGVVVTPGQLVWQSRGAARMPIIVPEIVRPSLRQTTDADGRVSFPTIDRMEFAELEFTSVRHGLQRTFTNNNTIGDRLTTDVMLFPVGRVAGQIVAQRPSDRNFLKGRTLLLRSRALNNGVRFPKAAVIPMEGFAEVTPDENGRFAIPAMAIGKLTLTDRLPNDADTRIVFPARIVVKAAETTAVEGRVISAVTVRGVLRTRGTNEPIPNASISLRHGKQSGLSRQLTVYSRTDDNGHFEAHVFPGRIGYTANSVAEGFVQAHQWEQKYDQQWPYGKPATVPDNVRTYALPPLELLPTAPVTGKVTDADGIPVANTGVYAKHTETHSGSDFARTNEAGEFTLKRSPAVFPPHYFRVGEQYKTKVARIVSRNPLVLQMATSD